MRILRSELDALPPEERARVIAELVGPPPGETPNSFDREENPAGVLPWRLEHAAYLARQLSTPTIYGQTRQVRRLEKRQGEIRTVPRD